MLAQLGLESWRLSKLRVALALALARAYALPTSLSRHPSGRAFAFPNLAGDGRVPSRCYLWVSAFLTMNEFNFFSSYSLFSIPSTLVLCVLEKRLQPLRATRFSIRGPIYLFFSFHCPNFAACFPSKPQYCQHELVLAEHKLYSTPETRWDLAPNEQIWRASYK